MEDADTPYKFGGKQYMQMNTITMVPMNAKLIDLSIMTTDEIQWLENYHKVCKQNLTPLLQGDEQTLKWLERNTLPLAEQQKL